MALALLSSSLVQISQGAANALMPANKPSVGEQYRFHFDMTKCIGCKCCEVACNEQNRNGPDLRWRRVGEIEAGEYPFTQRFHLSMGCNHCLDAACLKGCPVDAYNKDSVSGLVLHSADACIGCQYCTWNCPYGVPQYNEERGVVGKCDMCVGRLDDGRAPACVNACPEGAIQIELVNMAEWRQDYALLANAPGMPSADMTISTTRITLPELRHDDFEKADYYRARPEHPHWPLVFMLVLSQLSVGALLATWTLGLSPFSAILGTLIGHISLGVATLHLGRPMYAYRALKMWKRSWLSREVLSFSLFAGAASAYAGLAFLEHPLAAPAGAATALTGLAGIACSAFIYLVPARPAWDTWRTVADFYLTALLLGPLCALSIPGVSSPYSAYWIVLAGAAQLTLQVLKYVWLRRSQEFELRQSARLINSEFSALFMARLALLVAGAALALVGAVPLGLLCCVAGEIAGRYLFFVSVVPRNMAASFFSIAKEAA